LNHVLGAVSLTLHILLETHADFNRWHAPVSGTIKKAFVQDGTYFSEPLFEGLGDPNNAEINAGGISVGQGYLTSLATRAIIFIEVRLPPFSNFHFLQRLLISLRKTRQIIQP
jgi:hypothetical protein